VSYQKGNLILLCIYNTIEKQKDFKILLLILFYIKAFIS
jgi:hypothetical protein